MSQITVRAMTEADYDAVYALWKSIQGFAMRSLDDSREGIAKFLRRNPTTSVVALCDGKIVGAILCGNDGRRGCFYHVCVSSDYRRRKIGEKMVDFALQALKDEGITKVSLIAFKKNEVGNRFWSSIGWKLREDLNYYDYTLNTENDVKYNP